MGNGGNLEDAVKYAHERGVKPLLVVQLKHKLVRPNSFVSSE